MVKLRRMMTRLLCGGLSALLALTGCAAVRAEEAPASYVMAGFDGQDTGRQWADNAFFTEMQARTQVSFQFRQYDTQASWTAAKADMLSRPADLPDVLFKAGLTRAEEQALFDAGALIDLAPLLEENCPNLSALLAAHPDIRDRITLPGGQIVSLPYVTFAAAQNCMWINVKWLNQLKLEMPTDLEGLEAALRAFKTRDPNQNGRQDEIPLSFLGIFDLNFLSHAFGFLMNDYHIYAKDGQAVYAPLTDEYMAMIRWLREMYAEGLLDNNGFYTSDTLRAVTSSDSAQVYGMFFNPSLTNLVPADWLGDYQLLMPLTADGQQRYRDLWGSTMTGTFAITSACASPETLLKWVDTLYSLDGAILASLGRENVDYVIDGDGTWRLTDRFNAGTVYAAQELINTGIAHPGVSSDEFQLKYSDQKVARVVADTLRVNECCELPFPQVRLTQAQQDEISPLQQQIGLATDLQASRWVLGEDELDDASVAAFREQLDALGLDRFMRFWQQRLDEIGGNGQ